MADSSKILLGVKFDRRPEYVSDSNYLVIIDGIVLGFSKVNNLVMELESETYKEGGNNSLEQTIPKEESKSGGIKNILTLEKGVSKDLEGLIANNLIPGCTMEEVTIIVMKDRSEIGKVFYFEKGTVIKRSFSNLNAASGDIFMVTMDISHSGLKELPI